MFSIWILLGLISLYGVHAGSITTKVAAIGSRLEVDYDYSGVAASALLVAKRQAGQRLSPIFFMSMLVPGVTNYNISFPATNIMRLIINSVATSDYSSLFQILNTATNADLLYLEVSPSAVSACDSNGQKATSVNKARSGTVKLDCNIAGYPLETIVWAKYQPPNPPLSIFNNATLTGSSSMYVVANIASTSTLTISNVNAGTEDFYGCAQLVSGIPIDLGFYSVCSSQNKLLTSIANVLLGMVVVIFLI